MRRIVVAAAMPWLHRPLSLAAAGYLPLEPGNQWIYRVPDTGPELSPSRVGDTCRGSTAASTISLKGYVGEDVLVRYNEYGNLVYRHQDRNADVLLTSFEVIGKGWFEAPFRPCLHEGHVEENPEAYVRAIRGLSATLAGSPIEEAARCGRRGRGIRREPRVGESDRDHHRGPAHL